MTLRWLPWAINNGAIPPFPARFCIVTALGGHYGGDRFPWVATLCGDQPRLTSPVYFGARPPNEQPARCARCEELLAEQDRKDALFSAAATFEAGFRRGLAEGKPGL